MNITYACNCEHWAKEFIELVLRKANVEPNEFLVKSLDDRRIYIKTTVRGGRIKKQAFMAMSSDTEERTWIIKYEIRNQKRNSAEMHYVLFDTKSSTTDMIGDVGDWKVYHMTPTFIDDGAFKMLVKR